MPFGGVPITLVLRVISSLSTVRTGCVPRTGMRLPVTISASSALGAAAWPCLAPLLGGEAESVAQPEERTLRAMEMGTSSFK